MESDPQSASIITQLLILLVLTLVNALLFRSLRWLWSHDHKTNPPSGGAGQ